MNLPHLPYVTVETYTRGSFYAIRIVLIYGRVELQTSRVYRSSRLRKHAVLTRAIRQVYAMTNIVRVERLTRKFGVGLGMVGDLKSFAYKRC